MIEPTLQDDATALQPTALETLRRLIVPTYVPVFLSRLAMAMLVPILPLYLSDRGLSLGATSLVLAGAGIGGALGGLPSGGLIARSGERVAMLVGFTLSALAVAPLGLTDSVLILVGLRMIAGASLPLIRLSRQSFVTRRVRTDQRGRALSLVGGSSRVALAIGPLLGGFLAEAIGFRAAFVIASCIVGLGLVPSWVSDQMGPPELVPLATGKRRVGLIEGIRRYRGRVAVAGMFPLLFMAVREGRYVVLPLIADELGLSIAQVGLIVTASTVADMTLFPVAGWLMDRFSRLAAWIPALSLFAVGLAGLALADSATHVVIAGIVIGVGNGLSSGALLTFGSDLAPADAPGPFLASMGVSADIGRISGPLIIGFAGARLGLGGGALVLAAVMIAALAWVVLVVGEPSDPSRRRAHVLRG